MDGQESPTRLQKIGITCRTCNVSESFYSSLSIKQFKLEHIDHELVEGSSATSTAQGGKVRLLKVLVELVGLPTFSGPVFTVTGIKEDLKAAFVQVIRSDRRGELDEALWKGEYSDPASQETAYTWDPKAITFSEDAMAAITMVPPSSVAPKPADPDPVSEGAPSSGRESSPASDEAAPPSAVAPGPVVAPGPAHGRAPPPPPEAFPEPEASSERPSELSGSSIHLESEKGGVGTMSPTEPSQDGGVKEDSRRPVSSSRGIQEGQEDMSEVVRISSLLKPFRWKVEPAYTIGVMLDDILSIQTANQEISGALTKRIESAGYTFSGVTVDQGKPVAWFKKKALLRLSSLLDGEGASELKSKVLELDRSIEEERTKALKEKEDLEAWLLLLKRLHREAHAGVREPSPGGSGSESPEITGQFSGAP